MNSNSCHITQNMDGTSHQNDKFIRLKSIKTNDGSIVELPTKQFRVQMFSKPKSDPKTHLEKGVSTICFCSKGCLTIQFHNKMIKTLAITLILKLPACKNLIQKDTS